MLGHKFHTEGYFEFSFSPDCSFSAGCGLCRPHVRGASLLASGTHSKVGRSYPVLPVQEGLEQGSCPGRNSPRLSSPLQVWGVLALPPSLDCRAVGCGLHSSAQC